MALSKEETILALARLEWHLESDINLADGLTKAQLKARLEDYLVTITDLREQVMEPRQRRTKDEISKENAEKAEQTVVQQDSGPDS